jgi:hypothetical protein
VIYIFFDKLALKVTGRRPSAPRALADGEPAAENA